MRRARGILLCHPLLRRALSPLERRRRWELDQLVFDTYGVHGDTYICGNEKLAAIKNGSLSVAATSTDDNTSVQFDSPLDGVVAELLWWFKANFVYSEHKRRSARLKKSLAKSLKAPSGSAPLRRGRDNPFLTKVDKIGRAHV